MVFFFDEQTYLSDSTAWVSRQIKAQQKAENIRSLKYHVAPDLRAALAHLELGRNPTMRTVVP